MLSSFFSTSMDNSIEFNNFNNPDIFSRSSISLKVTIEAYSVLKSFLNMKSFEYKSLYRIFKAFFNNFD